MDIIKVIKGFGTTTTEVIEKAVSGGNNDIRVMMFGGRRCGKTSVLAAMQSCFDSHFGRGRLTISSADNETMLVIEDKHREINSYFESRGENRSFVPDDTPTTEKTEYSFNIGLKGKKDVLTVTFVDYPGEWLNQGDKLSTLEDMMNESHIILIAIDSPYLMEQVNSPNPDDPNAIGKYNDLRNYCNRIGEMMKKSFSLDENGEPKMILFVPLKCEKYYNQQKMGILIQRLKKAYETTFNYLEGFNKKLCEVAITPILTLGCAEFDRFRRENGEILLDEQYHTPKEALYIFKDTSVREPHPKYCEQPMVYILSYVFEMARRARDPKNKNVIMRAWQFVNEKFWSMPSAQDFFEERETVQKAMIKNDAESGYKLISNPLGF